MCCCFEDSFDPGPRAAKAPKAFAQDVAPRTRPATRAISKMEQWRLAGERTYKKFKKSLKTWWPQLLLDPKQPHRGVWLDCKEDTSGVKGVGCIACNQAKLHGAWAEMRVRSPLTLQLGHARRHADTPSHKLAVLEFLGKPASAAIAAPSAEQFKLVIEDRRKGVSLQRGNPRVGQAQKCTEMTLLLADSVFDFDREFVKKSTVCHLQQDARKLRLLTFFTCADSTWDSRSGILWSKKDAGSTSSDICEATAYSLGKFWTPLRGQFDGDGAQHHCDIVEHFGADGAGNQQTAGRLMKGKGLDGLHRIFSNCQQLEIDVTHGSTRLLKRPWHANEHMKQVFQTFIWSKTNLVNIIQHSPELTKRFHQLKRQLLQNPIDSERIKNLQMSKIRFNSCTLPVQRWVLFLRAVVMMAVWLTRMRKGKSECRAAIAFLVYIDEEKCVLQAMMGDAAQEVNSLTLFWDDPVFDQASSSAEIDNMIIACDALFIQRQALHSGLTKYMIDTLSRTPLTYKVDGTLKSLGGPGKITDDLINRCFAHMASWLRMVIHACEAEFPRFSLLRAFQVFHVGLHDCASPDMPTFFKKLAHVYKHLGVEAGPLETEFRGIARYARHAYNAAPSRGVTAAWKSARDKTQAKRSVRQNHPIRHLGHIGERLVCFRGMSTSKNEHAFADQKL